MKRYLIATLIGIILAGGGFLVSGCADSPSQPHQTATLGLTISLMNGQVQEAFLNQNIYIKGRVNDRYGLAQRSVRVNFALSPSNLGQITAFASTEPDSASGFGTNVTFVGRSEGVVLITGSVLDQDGHIAVSDTMHVLIKSGNW